MSNNEMKDKTLKNKKCFFLELYLFLKICFYKKFQKPKKPTIEDNKVIERKLNPIF